MENIEREIKILNIDVNRIKRVLKENKIEPKGKYIQDIYTFDIPTVDELYKKYVKDFINLNDSRALVKLIEEVRTCFTKEDIEIFRNQLGYSDIIDFIKDKCCKKDLLNSEVLIDVMRKTNENFSKWIRLRQTGDETTITIKKIVDSKGEYKLDAVDELELNVPDIEFGKQFLEDLGYFFARHQIKMRIAYDFKNTEIVIDKWPKLAPYLEVEGPSKEEIDEAVKMLGYSVNDEIIINTDDVYMRESGIDIYAKEYNDLSFDEKEQKEVDEYLQF